MKTRIRSLSRPLHRNLMLNSWLSIIRSQKRELSNLIVNKQEMVNRKRNVHRVATITHWILWHWLRLRKIKKSFCRWFKRQEMLNSSTLIAWTSQKCIRNRTRRFNWHPWPPNPWCQTRKVSRAHRVIGIRPSSPLWIELPVMTILKIGSLSIIHSLRHQSPNMAIPCILLRPWQKLATTTME